MTENTEKVNNVDAAKTLAFDPAEHYKQLIEANSKAIKSYLAAMETAPDIQNIASSVLSQLELVLRHIADTEYLTFSYEVRDLLARKESDLLGYSSFDGEPDSEDTPDPFAEKVDSLHEQLEALKKEFEDLLKSRNV